jgi:predicted aminopeptidase
VLISVLVGLSGCQTFSFYRQAISGQVQLLTHQQKVTKLIADPQTPAKLKTQLELLQQLREFAATNLHLPVDGHYRKYVDVHRPFVVWNVEATPELSMKPKSWWYPIVGSQDYRGYFSENAARQYADWLWERGYDVHVGGVSAYSTLGWFDDPVINTFVFEPEPDLAELIFHELGHQRLFLSGDTDFNEAFATTVGEEGAQRWLSAKGDDATRQAYAKGRERNRQFVSLTLATRARLEKLYGEHRTDGGLKQSRDMASVPKDQLRQQKAELLAQLQKDYAKLKAEWGGDTEYDAWFANHLNNAKLNSVAAYYELVPGFERLLAQNDGDLEKFYAAAERLSKKPKRERHQWLRNPQPVAGGG